jgi:hypothetical protein
MNKYTILTMLLLTAAGQVRGQADPDVDHGGKWTAEIRGPDGVPRMSTVLIKKFAGTWRESTKSASKGDPCAGKISEITVQHSVESKLEFTVWRSMKTKLCEDLTVELKSAGDGEFEGIVVGQGTIKLTR